MSYNIVSLTLFVKLSRFIPIKAPVSKDISIFNWSLRFVVKVYFIFIPLPLFVELSRFIPIKAPVYKDIGIFYCAICLL